MALTTLSESRCFGGVQRVCSHLSEATGTSMRLSIYLPPAAARQPVPALLFLSGLTCTEDNFTVKAGAQRWASERGLMLIAPDTSPRGEGVADDPAYDLGQGAGFYVDATEAPWAPHFRMYSYVADELPELLARELPLRPGALGVCGHSMGGHGALVLALRRPDRFRSVSAIAPICRPSAVPWGRKAFTAYLGADEAAWLAYDACALLRGEGRDGPARLPGPLLVDQGSADKFLAEQLRPDELADACADTHQALSLRMHPGYDHSYFFIATVIGDHVAHHAAALV
jgi:S-formylglutathione hydrolase